MSASNGNGAAAHPSSFTGERRPVLVTGGAGFIGCNLSDRLAREGHDVLVYDALTRPGVEQNLAWLKREHPSRVTNIVADLRDTDALTAAAAAAQSVFHFAAQVAVTTSLDDPQSDFAVNIGGTFALLEALRRHNPRAPLLFASTNKVYGNLSDLALALHGDAYAPKDETVRANGVGEDRPLCFHTPYGCSKGAADQYVLDYARSFGLRAAVMRMSCIYGPRQQGTEDQGWVAHFLLQALKGEPISIYGDGHQVRDVLAVSDAVDAYLGAWAHIDRVSGRAFNLGGGPANAVSLRQLVSHIEGLTGRSITLEFNEWREGDQRYYVSDTRAVRRDLSLGEPTPWREGVADLLEWFKSQRDPAPIGDRMSELRVAAGAQA